MFTRLQLAQVNVLRLIQSCLDQIKRIQAAAGLFSSVIQWDFFGSSDGCITG
jgi:hypothetical protein